MANTDFSNLTDMKRQAVEMKAREFFENNTPGYSAFEKAADKGPLTEKGYRIPYYSQRPGGHTLFAPSNSDFNAAVPPQTVSMWVYPTMYALPTVWTGSAIESFAVDPADNINGYSQIISQYTAAAQKYLNQRFYGDGTDSIAYSSTTTTALGSQSLTCTTAAATTAGQTKGAMWLLPGQSYQAINTSTAAVRGTFTVTTAATTTCTVNVTSGTVSSGDPLVSIGGYNMAPRGLAWLISDQARVLQGLSTSAYPDLNAPVVDLAGALLTPAAIENIKAFLITRNNDPKAKSSLTAFITPGQYSTIKKQGYNIGYYLRENPASDTMKGVQSEYSDGDTTFIQDADMDEDRVYFAQTNQMAVYEMKPFGMYDRDGLDQRMLLGANSTGSDNWQQAWGWKGNLAALLPRATAFIKRAQLPAATQVTSGI